MEESLKYFVPDISDIRVGYECEKIISDFSTFTDLFLPEGSTEELYAKVWENYYNSDKNNSEKYIITKEDFIELLKWNGDLRNGQGLPLSGFFRTPYLTKEQIEAEGWKASEFFEKVFMKYDKEWCYGLWLLENNKIHISKFKPPSQGTDSSKGETYIFYQGECKDINTFRYIIKLLGI